MSVLFKYGSQAAYNGLSVKDQDTIYVIHDTHRIYKGDVLAAASSIFTTVVPEYADALSDTIYVVVANGEVGLYIKDEASQTMMQAGGGALQPGSIADMNLFSDDILTKIGDEFSAEDDSHIPTTGAVATAIASAIKDADVNPFVGVRAVAQNDETFKGTILRFEHADGTYYDDVKVGDLFLTSASYDANTHKLSLIVQDSANPIEVDLTDLIPQAVTTEDVALAETITTTVTVGNIPKGTTIEVTDLQTFLVNMLSSDSWGTVTQPSVSLTTANNKAYEVGTKVVPTYSASFSAGSYEQTAKKDQVVTGVTTKVWTVTCTGQTSKTDGTAEAPSGKTSISGSFDEITVEDGTDVAVTVSVTHTAGAEPKSYLGNAEVDGVKAADKAIKEGSKSDTNNTHITSFRNCFWGYKTNNTDIPDPAAITVDQIKALGNTNKTKPATLTARGMQQMFFAVPATEATKLEIKGANPPAPQTVSGPVSIQIGGVDNYSPIAYNLFYVSNASAASGEDTYTLTWTK